MAKRKTKRARFVGVSLVAHKGLLRLEWRIKGLANRQTWSTGEKDTPENRIKWEEIRVLVAGKRALGEDPLVYLRDQKTDPRQEATKPQGPTIRSFYREWLETKEGVARPGRLSDYRTHLDAHILQDDIAGIPFADLEPLHVHAFIARLRQKKTKAGTPLSEKSIKNIIRYTLAAIFRDATVSGYVTRPLIVGIEWRQPTEEEREATDADPFSLEEWQAIETYFTDRTFMENSTPKKHPAFLAWLYFQRWHGARPSEASGLEWRDIDFKTGHAHIRRGFVRGHVGSPKTKQASRRVQLKPEMLTMLKQLRGIKADPRGIVFPNLAGERIRVSVCRGWWDACLRKLDIRHRGIYQLKHTFVTHVLSQAARSPEPQRLIAWLVAQTGVDIRTLKKNYAGWWPADREEIAATYALLDPMSPQRGDYQTQVTDIAV